MAAAVPNPIRVYADTSVYGGCFDEQFAESSKAFFDQVLSGRFRLVTSAVVEAEIVPAPLVVREQFDRFSGLGEVVDISAECLALQEAYMNAGIVGTASENDALHVAIATVNRCGIIVSWNFRHIVHFQKIPLYNSSNSANGYLPISIHSPAEVIAYEKEV